MNIDDLRRKMIAEGVPSKFAAIATGLCADYAQEVHKDAYNKGYADGIENEKDRPRREAGMRSLHISQPEADGVVGTMCRDD